MGQYTHSTNMKTEALKIWVNKKMEQWVIQYLANWPQDLAHNQSLYWTVSCLPTLTGDHLIFVIISYSKK